MSCAIDGADAGNLKQGSNILDLGRAFGGVIDPHGLELERQHIVGRRNTDGETDIANGRPGERSKNLMITPGGETVQMEGGKKFIDVEILCGERRNGCSNKQNWSTFAGIQFLPLRIPTE